MPKINKKVFVVIFLITAFLLILYSMGLNFLEQREKTFQENAFKETEEKPIDSNDGMMSEDINGLNPGIINYSAGEK